jgi:hypothetical protein
MNKQTQMYVGLGVLAVASYFVWKKMADKKAAAAKAAVAAAPAPANTAALTGNAGIVTKKFVGKMGADGLPTGVAHNATVADYNWSNASGFKGFHK